MVNLTNEERKLLLAIHQERIKDDPITNFEVFGQQGPFVEAVLYGKYHSNYYLGANRSGKSVIGAYIGARLARFGYPEDSPLSPKWIGAKNSGCKVYDRATAGWVSGLDFPTVRDTIQPKYFDNGYVVPGLGIPPFIPQREVESWGIKEQILKLKNGSIIGYKSAESGRKKYQGADKQWVHIDEEHPKDIMDEIEIRVGAQRLNIFTTATLLPPDGAAGGVNWIYQDVIVPWKAKLTPQIGVFSSSIYDNPHINEEELRRLEARFPVDSLQWRIRLNGELLPGMSGARIYANFNHELNIEEGLYEKFYLSRAPLAWCWDFNIEPMMTHVGQYINGRFYVYDQFFLDEGNIGDMCEMMKNSRYYEGHYGEIVVYGDASGFQRSHKDNSSSYTSIRNYTGGWKNPVRINVPSVNGSINARINSMNSVFRDFQGEVRFLVDSKCKELILDFDQVVSDGRNGIKKVSDKKNPYFWRTHASDGVGYWVIREKPVKLEEGAFGRYEKGKLSLAKWR